MHLVCVCAHVFFIAPCWMLFILMHVRLLCVYVPTNELTHTRRAHNTFKWDYLCLQNCSTGKKNISFSNEIRERVEGREKERSASLFAYIFRLNFAPGFSHVNIIRNVAYLAHASQNSHDPSKQKSPVISRNLLFPSFFFCDFIIASCVRCACMWLRGPRLVQDRIQNS